MLLEMATAGPSQPYWRSNSADFDIIAQLPSHQLTLDGHALTRSKSTVSDGPRPSLKRRPRKHTSVDEVDGKNYN